LLQFLNKRRARRRKARGAARLTEETTSACSPEFPGRGTRWMPARLYTSWPRSPLPRRRPCEARSWTTGTILLPTHANGARFGGGRRNARPLLPQRLLATGAGCRGGQTRRGRRGSPHRPDAVFRPKGRTPAGPGAVGKTILGPAAPVCAIRDPHPHPPPPPPPFLGRSGAPPLERRFSRGYDDQRLRHRHRLDSGGGSGRGKSSPASPRHKHLRRKAWASIALLAA